jgi:hypothetical protein
MATSFRKSPNASCCGSVCLGGPFAYPSRIRGDIGRGLEPCFRARNGGAYSFTGCPQSIWPRTESVAAVSWRQRTGVCKQFLQDVARVLYKRGVTVRGFRMGIRNGACCVMGKVCCIAGSFMRKQHRTSFSGKHWTPSAATSAVALHHPNFIPH